MTTPPPQHFADKLHARVKAVGAPVCVGIDPVYDRLPASLRTPKHTNNAREAAEAITRFTRGVIDAVASHAACVKLQSACFERYLWPGVEAYHRMTDYARRKGLVVIADAKRGDISISAEHYAHGLLADPPFDGLGSLLGPDAVTVNPYMGKDSVAPFLNVAADQGKGVFVLVRTSNPSGDAIQQLPTQGDQTVAQAVAKLVAQWGADQNRYVGQSGYSLLGAVVGATKPDEIATLRRLMPQQVFLVPGFGAQGGSAKDIKACFKPDDTGAVVTASRSVIYAFDQADSDWQSAVENAAIELKQQISDALA